MTNENKPALPESVQRLLGAGDCVESRDLYAWLNDALQAQASGQAVAPQGWKLVPVEPTEAMLLAGADAENNEGKTYLRPAWRYMLAAAPAAPTPEPAATVPVDDLPKLLMEASRRDALIWSDRVAIGRAIAALSAPTPEPVAVGQRAGRDEFPMLYDSLDALDERAAEQPERIAVRRHLSSLRKSIQQVVQRLSLARARIADLEAATPPAALDQQAVRDAAYERAAKRCEEIYEWRGAYEAGTMHTSTLNACAAAIRALKSTNGGAA